jgi:hypothetical protein
MNVSDLSYDHYRCPECDWEAKIPCPDHNMKKEKQYFVEITIKDSETLEPVRSVSTSSDYPESVLTYPHVKLLKEISACVDILCSTLW